MQEQAIDPCRCPLCGQPRAGAQAVGARGFSALLRQRLPLQAQGRACICKRCAEAMQGQQQQ